MLIRCAICGQELEFREVIEDGQTIACPCCGKSFVYSKPKLKVRRPAQTAERPGCVNDFVNQVEARANAERHRARLKRIKSSFNNVLALIVLAGIGFGGYKAYLHFQGDSEVWLPHALSDILTKSNASGEPEIEQTVRREEAALQKEMSRQKELAEKRQREAEEMKRKTAEKTRTFYEIRDSFAGARLGYWSELPKDKRPGTTDGEFGLVVPCGRGKCEYYKVSSRKDGVTVLKLSDTTEPQEISQPDYERMMKCRGGFFLKDGVAYFVSPSGSRKSWPAPTSKGATFKPAQCVFGEARAILEDRLFETGERCFDVYLAADDATAPVKVDTVRVGEAVDYAAFARAASDLLLESRSQQAKPKIKAKKVKRTVVFYDGSRIAKGMGGVTKIPRKPPTNRTDWYSDWVRLRDEAYRQEREEAKALDEAKRQHDEWRQKMRKAPTDSEIRQMLSTAIVTIKRK